MDDNDLNTQNKPDTAGSNERPNANGEPFDPVSNTEDVYQDTDTYGVNRPVPVCIEKPVRVQELPTQLGALTSVSVGNVATGGRAVRVLTADPRRRRARIEIPSTEILRLGTTQSAAQGEYAYRLYAGTAAPGVLEITSADELWAVGDGAAFLVSVANEQWQR